MFASNTWPFLIFFLPFFQNLEIKTDSAKALAESLDKAESPTFPYLNTLLRILATRCMMQAVYFCSGMDNDFHHYGLASPIYTHFTSPIRRYSYFTSFRGKKKDSFAKKLDVKLWCCPFKTKYCFCLALDFIWNSSNFTWWSIFM